MPNFRNDAHRGCTLGDKTQLYLLAEEVIFIQLFLTRVVGFACCKYMIVDPLPTVALCCFRRLRYSFKQSS